MTMTASNTGHGPWLEAGVRSERRVDSGELQKDSLFESFRSKSMNAYVMVLGRDDVGGEKDK